MRHARTPSWGDTTAIDAALTAGHKATEAARRGTAAFDAAYGERPWRAIGLDTRQTRIARSVLTRIVPDVAGARVASIVDGAAIKGSLLWTALQAKLPLRALVLSILAGLASWRPRSSALWRRSWSGTGPGGSPSRCSSRSAC